MTNHDFITLSLPSVYVWGVCDLTGIVPAGTKVIGLMVKNTAGFQELFACDIYGSTNLPVAGYTIASRETMYYCGLSDDLKFTYWRHPNVTVHLVWSMTADDGAVWLGGSVDKTPALSGWQDITNSEIPANSVGLYCMQDISGIGGAIMGMRRKGSTDAFQARSAATGSACGVNSNKELQVYIGDITRVKVYLQGYIDASKCTLRDNGVDVIAYNKVLSAWYDIPLDLADSQPPSATAVAVLYQPTLTAGYMQRYNSQKWFGATSPSLYQQVEWRGGHIIGMPSKKISNYTNSNITHIWVLGYIGADPVKKDYYGKLNDNRMVA